MTIPPKYEDVVAKLDAALGREAALREELEREKSNLRAFTHLAAVRLEMYETSQQRLTISEQRAEDLKKLLCDVINEAPTGFAAPQRTHRARAKRRFAPLYRT